MSWKRLDLYQECNTIQAPADEFAEQYCSRCVNPECTRSQYGKTKFDTRTQTWEERLFTQVAKLEPSDPRFGDISHQRFIEYREPLVVEANADWTPKKPIAEQIKEAPAVILEAPTDPVKIESTTQEDKPVEEVPKPVTVDRPLEQQKPRSKLSPEVATFNTPMPSGGIMLPGAPPKSDWTVPEPLDETVQVVKPGAKIKFED